jgi:hypothetical protein
LLLIKDGRKLGIEFKRIDAPRLTPSMRISIEDLKPDNLTVIYPGDRRYSLSNNITVIPLNGIFDSGN